MCAALSGVVIRFINAGITRDVSSPLLLTHSVASFLLRATGIASASPSSICLSCLLSLSFPLPPSLASSFFFGSRLFCFLRVTSVYVCLSLCHSPLQSVRADISGSLRQVVRCGFTRLREIRDEKRSVRVTIRFSLSDMSCDVLKVVRTRTRSAQFAPRLLTGK